MFGFWTNKWWYVCISRERWKIEPGRWFFSVPGHWCSNRSPRWFWPLGAQLRRRLLYDSAEIVFLSDSLLTPWIVWLIECQHLWVTQIVRVCGREDRDDHGQSPVPVQQADDKTDPPHQDEPAKFTVKYSDHHHHVWRHLSHLCLCSNTVHAAMSVENIMRTWGGKA